MPEGRVPRRARSGAEGAGLRRAGAWIFTLMCLFPGSTVSVRGQNEPQSAVDASPASAADDPGQPRYRNGHEAYENGDYEEALRLFADQQVERPNDAEVRFNLGSAQYKGSHLDDAGDSFAAAAATGSAPDLRAAALYNLGNTAYSQGRLEEAAESYESALEITPDDEDAKFNLELVRREIDRRRQQAEERSQEFRQQQEGGDQSQEGQRQDDGRQEQGSTAAAPDTDGDGLPDDVERNGDNPTDPENPDSDGDGLADGSEDLDADGSVDEGETDPNRRDSDGDGTADGQDLDNFSSTGAGDEQSQEKMTEEEAQRYLSALEEERPQRSARKATRGKPEKDW